MNKDTILEIQQLITTLNDPHPHIRFGAANTLAGLGTIVLHPLLDVLRSSLSEHARTAAAYALGTLQDQDAVAALIHALEIGAHDLPTSVSYHAAVALERIATPHALAAVDFWRETVR